MSVWWSLPVLALCNERNQMSIGSTEVKVSCALSKKTQGESGIYATRHIAFSSRWPRKMRRLCVLHMLHRGSMLHDLGALCPCFPHSNMYMKRNKKRDVLILVSNISLCYLNLLYLKSFFCNTAVCWHVVLCRNVEQLYCDIPSSYLVLVMSAFWSRSLGLCCCHRLARVNRILHFDTSKLEGQWFTSRPHCSERHTLY